MFFFARQCTPILPLSNYQGFIYQQVDFSPLVSLVFTSVWSTVSTFTVMTIGFLFDKIGQRNALFMLYSTMISAMAIIVSLWAAYEASSNSDLAHARGTIFSIFLTCYGISPVINTFGPVYEPEIVPSNIRAGGLACAYFVFNAMIILWVQMIPLALAAISWKLFLIFLILDCVYFVSVYLYYPEIKNKSLEEIEGIFGDVVAFEVGEKQLKGDSNREDEKEDGSEHVEAKV